MNIYIKKQKNMNIINEEILKMKTRLDKLLMSFNHAIDFDKSVYDIIKETRIRTKKLLLKQTSLNIKFNPGNQKQRNWRTDWFFLRDLWINRNGIRKNYN